jgi:hypothetical protein
MDVKFSSLIELIFSLTLPDQYYRCNTAQF